MNVAVAADDSRVHPWGLRVRPYVTPSEAEAPNDWREEKEEKGDVALQLEDMIGRLCGAATDPHKQSGPRLTEVSSLLVQLVQCLQKTVEDQVEELQAEKRRMQIQRIQCATLLAVGRASLSAIRGETEKSLLSIDMDRDALARQILQLPAATLQAKLASYVCMEKQPDMYVLEAITSQRALTSGELRTRALQLTILRTVPHLSEGPAGIVAAYATGGEEVFDGLRCDNGLDISANGRSITHAAPNQRKWVCSRVGVWMRDGIHLLSARLEKGTQFTIGVVDGYYESYWPTFDVGACAHSWSVYFQSHRSTVWHRNTGTSYGPAAKVGDVVTGLLDVDAGTFSVSLNNVPLGLAHMRLPHMLSWAIGVRDFNTKITIVSSIDDEPPWNPTASRRMSDSSSSNASINAASYFTESSSGDDEDDEDDEDNNMSTSS